MISLYSVASLVSDKIMKTIDVHVIIKSGVEEYAQVDTTSV